MNSRIRRPLYISFKSWLYMLLLAPFGRSAAMIAQINVQEDMIKCALHIKIESKITMLPIYNFEFTIKCEDVYYMKH